jgi:hypothetical protein
VLIKQQHQAANNGMGLSRKLAAHHARILDVVAEAAGGHGARANDFAPRLA